MGSSLGRPGQNGRTPDRGLGGPAVRAGPRAGGDRGCRPSVVRFHAIRRVGSERAGHPALRPLDAPGLIGSLFSNRITHGRRGIPDGFTAYLGALFGRRPRLAARHLGHGRCAAAHHLGSWPAFLPPPAPACSRIGNRLRERGIFAPAMCTRNRSFGAGRCTWRPRGTGSTRSPFAPEGCAGPDVSAFRSLSPV